MFLVARFLLGFGIPFAIVAASSMIGELSYPRERARLGSLFNASWFIGAIVAAGVTLGTFSMRSTWGWRIPSALQIVPSLLQVTFIWFLPESPRYDSIPCMNARFLTAAFLVGSSRKVVAKRHTAF